MEFRNHSNLVGTHAYLGASNYHWINYSEESFIEHYRKFMAVERGTRLHDLASRLIKEKEKLPKKQRTLNMFVNDAIGFRMTSEQPLVYSDNCYGTADAISFRDNILRIHDLKTGETAASMNQLYVYAALFCLEYKIKPSEIECELRIYQADEVRIEQAKLEVVTMVMDKIIAFDKLINKLKEEG